MFTRDKNQITIFFSAKKEVLQYRLLPILFHSSRVNSRAQLSCRQWHLGGNDALQGDRLTVGQDVDGDVYNTQDIYGDVYNTQDVDGDVYNTQTRC